MLNEGIKTDAVDFVHAVVDPDATTVDVVDALRLPRSVAVEQLLLDELRAIDSPLGVWSELAGTDMREVFLRNSACKRVLYVSAPIFLPDIIEVPTFKPKGVNTRVHVFAAPDVRDTVRLEAVSTYTIGAARFRYALSIQYLTDSAGLGWQLIRPVVVLDRGLLDAVRRSGSAARAALDTLLDTLRRTVLMGSHDYVHATVLNWFPPLSNLAPDYAAITSERAHPAELADWHVDALMPLPAGFVPTQRTPGIASLELYSLMVHGQIARTLWDSGDGTRDYARDLVSGLDDALSALVAATDFGDDSAREAVAEYFSILAAWFVVSAFPIGSAQLADVLPRLTGPRAEIALRHLAEVHEGMFDFVRHVDAAHYPWGDRIVTLHDVGDEYAAALRAPTLREHLRFLLTPGPATGGRAWLDRLTESTPGATRAAAVSALADARDAAVVDAPALRDRLVASGAWQLLQRSARQEADGVAPGANDDCGRYARMVLRSALAIVDELARESPAPHPDRVPVAR